MLDQTIPEHDNTPDVVGTVVTLFAAILDTDEEITEDTDFFEAGGNSVLAARALARIRTELGVRLSMREFFAARTAGVLARKAAEKQG
ncbi:acyl carrier protein [Actinoalloteichus hymeniacidonis]|uniref:Phosphopantetheine-containing protein n=1 Tax=Actinoalloteichus hymeniacidonis TaxID=340345 RepID=A0AAC9MZ79_9PSEU|nr:acyl carrier protein [Actinoalloteichus hymeniacidonis]AOS63782.1 phosphopantetheine-containing protein [Actinoalloteichus hymeniacidonis]MBB5908164.1 acyl carrier protein [Actinoalloteichus hymeniacidonis]